jgi:hypothetical protein
MGAYEEFPFIISHAGAVQAGCEEWDRWMGPFKSRKSRNITMGDQQAHFVTIGVLGILSLFSLSLVPVVGFVRRRSITDSGLI